MRFTASNALREIDLANSFSIHDAPDRFGRLPEQGLVSESALALWRSIGPLFQGAGHFICHTVSVSACGFTGSPSSNGTSIDRCTHHSGSPTGHGYSGNRMK